MRGWSLSFNFQRHDFVSDQSFGFSRGSLFGLEAFIPIWAEESPSIFQSWTSTKVWQAVPPVKLSFPPFLSLPVSLQCNEYLEGGYQRRGRDREYPLYNHFRFPLGKFKLIRNFHKVLRDIKQKEKLFTLNAVPQWMDLKMGYRIHWTPFGAGVMDLSKSVCHLLAGPEVWPPDKSSCLNNWFSEVPAPSDEAKQLVTVADLRKPGYGGIWHTQLFMQCSMLSSIGTSLCEFECTSLHGSHRAHSLVRRRT